MGYAKKQHIEALNGERCWHCNKEMTEEELNKVVDGVSIKKCEDGTVWCADCVCMHSIKAILKEFITCPHCGQVINL